jgi:hypothetical protein
MPRIRYVDMAFGTKRMAVVDQATEICEEYARQGFSLTLRQLYYQFVARGLLVNKQSEYKRLGEILNDARLAGLFDWNYLIESVGADAGRRPAVPDGPLGGPARAH